MTDAKSILKTNYVSGKTTLSLYSEYYEFSCTPPLETHAHEFFEIGLILEGEVIHRVGNSTYKLFAGDVYMIPLNVAHSIEIPGHLHIQNIYLLPHLYFEQLQNHFVCSSLLNDFILNCISSSENLLPMLRLTPEQFQNIQLLIAAYQNKSFTKRALQNHFDLNCLQNILCVLCDAYNHIHPVSTIKKDSRIYTILHLIHDYLFYDMSEIMHRLQLELCLHPQYINRLVKQELDTTLSSLILNTKIEKSCELLLQNHSISDVAQILCFYDHSHFNKYFKKHFGISPSQYLQKYK